MIRAVQITDAPTIQKLNADQLNYDYPLTGTIQTLTRILTTRATRLAGSY